MSPRVSRAFNAMQALGIPPKQVKPVLKELLKLYGNSWEFIEAENYRVLADAIFESKDDKGVEVKKENIVWDKRSESPIKALQLAQEEDGVSSRVDSSIGTVAQKEDGIFPASFAAVRAELSQSHSRDQQVKANSQLLKTLPVDRGQDRISSERASSSVCMKRPADESGSSHAKRGKIPAYHRDGNMTKLNTEHHESGSLHVPVNCKKILPGSRESLNGFSQSVDTENKENGSACNHSHSTAYRYKIASSSHGDVKLSLSFGSALGKANFHTLDRDAVLRYAEKFLKSHTNIVWPPFSLKKLLGEICESFLELVSNSSNGGLVAKPSLTAINHYGLQSSVRSSEEFPKVKKSEGVSIKKERGTSNVQGLPESGKHQPCFYIDDITKGAEKMKISLVDDNDKHSCPNFFYIPRNIIYQNAHVNISLARISEEDCCSNCSGNCVSRSVPCACARETGGEFAYNPKGLLKEEFLRSCISMNQAPERHHLFYCQDCPVKRYKDEPCKGHLLRRFIKECWSKCGCHMDCANRVVQRGITCNLQVTWINEGKGWGLRTLEDLPKGAFVCEYVGEILTNTELYERNLQSSGNERHTYPVQLDADWGSESILEDEELLCLDATFYGNVARFINHRCHDANLIEIPVEVETLDHHYYHLAFFTTRVVKAFEELTWDYQIDFDDHDHPIKAFQCCCGSEFCRDKSRKGKGKAKALC
ncbi:hypothetical protein Ancab_000380 [Ancistrocladus abbreviatus]